MFRYNIIHVLQLVLGFSNGVFASNVSCDVLEFFLGDGYCDAFSNNEQCNYDGGDCCECTCVDGSYYACSSTWNDFSCIDPTSGCLHSRAIEYPNCTGSISALENGSCDQELNNLECGFDGGDCCECSCVDGPDYVCENDSAYLCINPDSDCVDTRVAEFPSCTGNLAYAADGSCDDFNNNPDCGFDWGDCCLCSLMKESDSFRIFSYTSSSYTKTFNCLDPDAADWVYDCKASPPPPHPCPGDSDGRLVVEKPADVTDVAETIYCTGGKFEVEWRGNIMVDQGIVVPTGTVLDVTGIGPNATIDGGGFTRLFTVLNGTLNVANLSIINGSSLFGGAIYSWGSTLTFHGTSFVGNVAPGSGGALLMSNGSNACFFDTVFSANRATVGGAVHLTNDTRALWVEVTTFSANLGTQSGGAVYVSDGGEASWVGVTTFSGNIAESYGGAVHVEGGGNASWAEETTFSENNSSNSGGAINVDSEGKASWTGVMTFSGNVAGYAGGAMHLPGGEVWWAGETIFSRNIAYFGGAARVSGEIRCSSTAKVTFTSNIAANAGGALYIDGRVSWGADTLFFNNTADSGGALIVTDEAYVVFEGEVNFTANTAFSDGGAVGSLSPDDFYSSLFEEPILTFNGFTYFANNSARVNGGGMALFGTLSALFNTNVVFYGNVANVAGGGVYLSATTLGPTFNGFVFDSNSAQMGGGMYATGSGTYFEKSTYYPVTFIECTFVNNVADASGGAVNTASGRYKFLRTSFELNSARVGGALRLAGETSLDACLFVDNISDSDEGPAVSNLGLISNFTAGSFKDNKYVCEAQNFFSFTEVQSFLFSVHRHGKHSVSGDG